MAVTVGNTGRKSTGLPLRRPHETTSWCFRWQNCRSPNNQCMNWRSPLVPNQCNLELKLYYKQLVYGLKTNRKGFYVRQTADRNKGKHKNTVCTVRYKFGANAFLPGGGGRWEMGVREIHFAGADFLLTDRL